MTEAASPSSKITFCVYATQYKTSYGVPALGSECVAKTKEVLEARYGKGNVCLFPDRSYLNKLKKDCVLVLPGGNFFAQAIDLSTAASVVKEFVESGGGAIGICAGGMMTSKTFVSKESGKVDSILEDFGFSLLPVSVSAPSASEPVRTSSIPNDSGEEVLIIDREQVSFRAYRNKGGDIHVLDKDAGIQNEAFYMTISSPYNTAAVSGPCGKGRVVNIQYHPEFDPAEVLEPKKKDDSKDDSKSPEKAEPSKSRTKSLKSFYRIVDTNFFK